MDRRAFLLLKTRGRERVVELSCERLYMRWSDALAGAGRVGVGASPEPVTEPWAEEPPTEHEGETTHDLLTGFERELATADVLHLRDPEWLADPDFRAELESLIAAFRARGGRVE